MDASSAVLISTLYSMYGDDVSEEEGSSSVGTVVSNLEPGLFLELPEDILYCIFSHLSLGMIKSWWGLLREMSGTEPSWDPTQNWKGLLEAHVKSDRRNTTLNRLVYTETLRLSVKIYSSMYRGVVILPNVPYNDGRWKLNSENPDAHSLPFPPHNVKFVDIGLTSRYFHSNIATIFRCAIQKGVSAISNFTLTSATGDVVKFSISKSQITLTEVNVKCDHSLWNSGLQVLRDTLDVKNDKVESLQLSMQILEALCNPEGIDMEESRANVINIAKELFSCSKEEVSQFLGECEIKGNQQLKDICQKCVGILFQKAKLPPWPQIQRIFLRDDFMKQFFYFTSLIDEEFKDFKNITKNNRICHYLEIPSLFNNKKLRQLMEGGDDYSSDSNDNDKDYSADSFQMEIPPVGKVGRLVCTWFAAFREYFIHWNYQRGDVMVDMANQEVENIIDDIEYLES